MAERETSKVISSGASDRVLYAIGLIALFGQLAINAIDNGSFGFPKRGWLVAVLLGLMPLIGMMWVPLVRRVWRGRDSWDYYAAGAALGVVTSACVCFGVLAVISGMGRV